MSAEYNPNTAARTELSKFFALAVKTQRSLEMWSGFIDEEWHEFQRQPEFESFCISACGQHIGHVEYPGRGQIPWIADYEAEFGPVPEIWFKDKQGITDRALFDEYRKTGRVYASWDCGPLQPDDMSGDRLKRKEGGTPGNGKDKGDKSKKDDKGKKKDG